MNVSVVSGGILPIVKCANRRPPRQVICGWRKGRTLLERWRKNLTRVQLGLKKPRVMDLVPIGFVGGEPVERQGMPSKVFRGQLIYFKSADMTIRRPSGAILVIDNYEIVALSDQKTRFEPV